MLPHLASQCCGLHLRRGTVVTVDNSADYYLAAHRFRKHECVKRQQQFVIPPKFVRVDEAHGHELRWSAPAFRRYSFNSVKFGLERAGIQLCPNNHVGRPDATRRL